MIFLNVGSDLRFFFESKITITTVIWVVFLGLVFPEFSQFSKMELGQKMRGDLFFEFQIDFTKFAIKIGHVDDPYTVKLTRLHPKKNSIFRTRRKTVRIQFKNDHSISLSSGSPILPSPTLEKNQKKRIWNALEWVQQIHKIQ